MDHGPMTLERAQMLEPHGTPGGHILPGVLFLVLGLQWTFGTLRALLHRPSQASRSWYPMPLSWRGKPVAQGWPIEPALKLCFPALGIFVELYAKNFSPSRMFFRPLWAAGAFTNVSVWVHAALYLVFATCGLVELVGACLKASASRSSRSAPRHAADDDVAIGSVSLRRVELCFTALALGFTGFQLHLHAAHGAHGHVAPFYASLHQFQAYLHFVGMAAALSEAWAADPLDAQLGALVRAVSVTLAGTWMLQMSVFYFKPITWIMDPGANEALQVLLALHVLAVMLGTLLVALVMGALASPSAGARADERHAAEAEAEAVSLVSGSRERTRGPGRRHGKAAYMAADDDDEEHA